MPIADLVPLSKYLTTSYRPDFDFVDGRILERNVGEFQHSRMLTLLSAFLLNREKLWGIYTLMSCRTKVSATRVRVPDIVVTCGEPPSGPIISEPPFLCIEILSPNDRLAEMQDRIDDYL